ncbi:hypothetical protein AcW1_009662 [Taiwanofungus camphoratus]|nr:hypothetical protein AcV5_002441 [Antrodia cinnamomea]KAI0941998.1 hypothetical protein AcV7_002546 [Antrodia cinnamomea]KAI0948057.1 hypothetical protein AcW1_009662 [Antrodia cinnamomea]
MSVIPSEPNTAEPPSPVPPYPHETALYHPSATTVACRARSQHRRQPTTSPPSPPPSDTAVERPVYVSIVLYRAGSCPSVDAMISGSPPKRMISLNFSSRWASSGVRYGFIIFMGKHGPLCPRPLLNPVSFNPCKQDRVVDQHELRSAFGVDNITVVDGIKVPILRNGFLATSSIASALQLALGMIHHSSKISE